MAAAGWSDLPEDLLFPILRRLILVDYVRFGAVCSSWRSAARDRPYPPAPQSPWLMFPGPEGGEPSTARFLSLSRDGRDNKIYTLFLPVADLRDEWIFGSSHGWLFVVDRRCDVRMLNPITGATIALPPLSTFPDVEPVLDSSGTVTAFTVGGLWERPPSTYARDQMQRSYFTKIVAVPGPAGFSKGDYTAVAIAHVASGRLSFARGGDDKWSPLLTLNDNIGGFQDVVYYKGLFYGIALPGWIVAFDLSGPVPKVKGVTMNKENAFLDLFYFVESSGELLMVLRSVTFSKGRAATCGVKLFKLDGQQSRWVKVTSLGSRALFLGLGDSISLSTIDFPELRENCIYFTDDLKDYSYGIKMEGEGRDVGVYSIEDSTMRTELFHPYKIGMNRTPALWITPHM